MSDQRKEIMNEVFDTTLYVGAAVGVSMLSKKAFREPLGTPESGKGILKMVIAMSLGTVAVKYAQNKNWIPTDPFTPKK